MVKERIKTPIRKVREQLGLSQAEMGRKCGATKEQVIKWERSKDPHISTLIRISKGLNVTLNKLAGLTILF